MISQVYTILELASVVTMSLFAVSFLIVEHDCGLYCPQLNRWGRQEGRLMWRGGGRGKPNHNRYLTCQLYLSCGTVNCTSIELINVSRKYVKACWYFWTWTSNSLNDFANAMFLFSYTWLYDCLLHYEQSISKENYQKTSGMFNETAKSGSRPWLLSGCTWMKVSFQNVRE